MRLSHWNVYHFSLPLLHPFTTHQGSLQEREGIIVEGVSEDGQSGWGECVAFSTPFYTEETVDTAWFMLNDLLLSKISSDDPSNISHVFSQYQGHPMAKAAIEMAIWDLKAKQGNHPLYHYVGGIRDQISTGVVISLKENWKEKVDKYKEQGYQRYKLKINKENAYEHLNTFRTFYPDLPLMIDGNGAYQPDEMAAILALDDFKLLMIEQPFRAGDFYWHAQLQKKMKTSICLDESIKSYEDGKQAYFMRSGKSINIKIGRVGGWREALSLHQFLYEKKISLWVGGMVETGISKAHSLALASLPGFMIPGDLSPSDRFWDRDFVYPSIQINQGKISLPNKPGIGFEVDREFVEKQSIRKNKIKLMG
ncbi:o-succinylbenzoate synthase [Bacillaceae bacterium S4-13-58]